MSRSIPRILPWLLLLVIAVLSLFQQRNLPAVEKGTSTSSSQAWSVETKAAAETAETNANNDPNQQLLQHIGASLVAAMGLDLQQASQSQLQSIQQALQASQRNFRYPSTLPAKLANEKEETRHSYTDCRNQQECATQILYHLTNGLDSERKGRHPWNGSRERIFPRMFMMDMMTKYQHRIATGSKCLEWSPIFYTDKGHIFGEKCTEKWSFDFTQRGHVLKSVPKRGGGGGSLQGDICSPESTAVIPPELEGTFDFILMTDVLEHLPDPFVALSVVSRLLKPGGLLLKTAPWVTMTHNKFHFWGANAKGLLEVLERSGLQVETLRMCGQPASVVQYMYGLNADFFNDEKLFTCQEQTAKQVKGRGYMANYLQAQAVATKPKD